MKEQILKILRQSEGYVSGQDICRELGISRTAVWKYINRLKSEGYRIEAVQNKGYHILECPDVLSEAEISSLLETKSFGRSLYFFDVIDSTNNEAKRKAESAAPHGTLIVAETQDAGRGRRGKNWTSPVGSGIWMSFILRPDIPPERASMLTIVVSLAVAGTLNEIVNTVQIQIKWPNDILINGKKVCGILTEMSAEPDFINHIVIGTGINVNTPEFDESIKNAATSLFIETGKNYQRSTIIASFGKQFEKYYDMFLKTQDLSLLVEEYNAELININKTIKVINEKESFLGEALGINAKGELLVEKEDGKVVEILAGEVSVRGVYGYV